MTDVQLFLVRAWRGASPRPHVAARRVADPDWTPLASPEELVSYLQAALADDDRRSTAALQAGDAEPGSNA